MSTRIGIRLPEGYAKDAAQEGRSRFNEFVKTLKGYDPPHIAGRIRFHGMPADAVMPTSDRQMIPCSDVEKVLDDALEVAETWDLVLNPRPTAP